MARPEKHVFVCVHERPADHPDGSCGIKGSKQIVDGFAKEFQERNLWGRFKLNTTSCLGTCEHGPSVLVYPEGVLYQKVQAEDINVIIDKHLLGGKPVESLKISRDVWD
ncbi:MAG: (2Fe-2S) ferredoxin domain-containing protein [Hyphomicrobiales bacterium]|nr:(2Fe-2S) ferredoxin domain-containing protein [Hyphomicrobiales bacterium]